MAIRVKLDHLLLDRRLTLTDLADRIGITIANLSVLKTNKARAIRFSTLEALCRELDCQPGDAQATLDPGRKNYPIIRSANRREVRPFGTLAWVNGSVM
jgi:putative transcriptional regulator